MIGWGSGDGLSGVMIDESLALFRGGCFLRRMFRTESVEAESVCSCMFRLSRPPLLSSDINLMASLTLPSIISFAKICAV